MQTIQYLTITKDYSGQRLDNFLISRLKGLPKSRLYRIIRKGELRIYKKRVKPDYRLQEGDIIRVPPLSLSGLPTKKKVLNEKQAKFLEKTIIFEDKHLLVLNKPSGMAVHGGSGITLGVIEAFRLIRPQLKFLELVHRLDRETSGCLLMAKKRSILKELHELLRLNGIKKTYIALVSGHWPPSLLSVAEPLYKNQRQSGERMVRVQPEGKRSLTKFSIQQYYSDSTLVTATPITGRTHQIRVHAQCVNHPIIGDEKYGNKEINKKMRQLGCKRLFLHASELVFTLPSQEKTLTLQAKLPEDLNRLLNQLRSPHTH
ncbi:23S rRNA pseudouridine(955/2504/2580) synthase RluC [Rickettsiella grylli]|uniref:Pseudouridine synthase n=1 Tax=Rickettsiella grylli TaxID=59196 RepID=A8PP27_9COXI|nr:23S rRNA pseudouridine(955/2504/2580) synthase RluC [Rickettsiella grylli]EDP46534.1 ribosomal large subunit pseudouridine synthase C [Rickettsiella grylli]